jgi:hypothetical protein
MILILHILIALSSVALSTVAWFRPSALKLKGSYALVAMTLASGTYLVVTTGASMLRSCMTGLMYTLVVTVILAAAHHRLATEVAEKE